MLDVAPADATLVSSATANAMASSDEILLRRPRLDLLVLEYDKVLSTARLPVSFHTRHHGLAMG